MTFTLLSWPFFLATLISLGTYFAVYLLASPVLRIGDVELEKLNNGAELKALYETSVLQVKQMKATKKEIKQAEISSRLAQLIQKATSILTYLEANPKEISSSRHFLDYYLSTANKISQNYLQMEAAQISSDKFKEIEHKTAEALKILDKIFANQRDGYHVNRMRDLEVETELLEKTLELGGGYLDEE